MPADNLPLTSLYRLSLAPVILLLFLFLNTGAWAQRYQSITTQGLDNRVSQGGDTVFVINFWATWCGPCIKELPYFDELQQAYAGRPLKVLLVSVDAPSLAEASLIAFLKKREIISEVLHLNEAKPHEYIDRIAPEWSGSIPATLVRVPSSGKRVFHEEELTLSQLQSIVKPLIN